MDNINLIQLITGQSPAMALSIILLIFYNRQNSDMLRREKEYSETQLRREKEYSEAQLRERKEERDLTREIRQQQIDLLREVVESLSQMKAEIHALRNQLQNYVFSEESKRKTGGSRGD